MMNISVACKQNNIMCRRMLYSRANYMAGASDCLSVRLKIVQHQYFFIDHADCPGAKLKPPGFLLLSE